MKTKKGMASLYLVAFTTLLLGIVTMSFARVMISESREASNSDLSQSAFDSALAGIEDAKTAILMYQKCQDGAEDVSGKSCEDINRIMTEGLDNKNCDTVRKILTGGEGEVAVSEGLEQYYTCVPIANDSSTYQSVLNEGNRSRVIPAKIKDTEDKKDLYKEVVGVELQWFTPESTDDASTAIKYMNEDDDGNFIPLDSKEAARNDTDKLAAPILTFELFQTDETFSMYQLDLNNETNTGTDHAMIMLYPDKNLAGEAAFKPGGTFVSARNLLDASNKSNQAALNATADTENSVVPKPVTCGYTDGGPRCRTTIEFPATYKGLAENLTGTYNNSGVARAKQTFMFRVSLPYGAPDTDFSIRPCLRIEDGVCNDYADFTGVQYIVDSTGRASDLYRRIIARVETTPKFIFPEYAVQVSGENSVIEKNFYVTENCWSTDGKGNSTTCANNGDAK